MFYTLINFNRTGLRIIIALFIALAFYAIYVANNSIANNSIIHIIPIICLLLFWPCLIASTYYIYTDKGKQKLHEIYGFKLYLMNQSIKTKYHTQNFPIKTIELYEKYLPYAIALNIEKQWTKQFIHIVHKPKYEHESSGINLQFFNLYILNDFIKAFSQVSTIKSNWDWYGLSDSGENSDAGDGGW